MNKVSSKLAAGVRQVKTQQKSVPAAPQPARPKTENGAEKPAVNTGCSGNGAVLHPTRIWPD